MHMQNRRPVDGAGIQREISMKLKQLCEMVFVLSVIVLANRARAQQIESGRWSGVATVHGQQVPVQLDLSAKS